MLVRKWDHLTTPKNPMDAAPERPRWQNEGSAKGSQLLLCHQNSLGSMSRSICLPRSAISVPESVIFPSFNTYPNANAHSLGIKPYTIGTVHTHYNNNSKLIAFQMDGKKTLEVTSPKSNMVINKFLSSKCCVFSFLIQNLRIKIWPIG